MLELENLYNTLYSDNRYTKSYEEFQTQFENPLYRQKVYKEVAATGEYQGVFSQFESKYYPKLDFKPKEVKKPETDINPVLLQNYLRQLEEINLNAEEIDEINFQSTTSNISPSIGLYQEDALQVQTDFISAPIEAFDRWENESFIKGDGSFSNTTKTTWPYQKFLNAEQNNHEEARQKWIREQRNNLINDKAEEILNQLEDDIKPLWADIGNVLIKAGYGEEADLGGKTKKYQQARNILTAEFNRRYKEKEGVIVKTSNDLQLLADAVKEIDLDMGDIENIFELYKDNLSQSDVDNYNSFIETRKSLIVAYNAKLNTLNELEVEAGDLAAIGDLTKRTYNNFDILENRLGSTTIRLGSGALKFAKEIAGAGERIEGVDYNSPEFLATMPEYIRPIVSNYGKGLDLLEVNSRKLYNEAEKINLLTAKRQEFGKVENIGDFGMFMLDLMSEQAVNSVVTYSTGGLGLAIISAGAAGNKFTDMDITVENGGFNSDGQPEDIKISPLQYYTTGIGYGLAEFITEKVALENLKYGIKNYKKAFGLGSKYSLKSATFGDELASYSFGTFSEGTSELTASVLQNALDKYMLGNDDVNLMDGTNEAFWSGVFMSGLGFRAPGLAASAYKAATTKVDFDKINRRSQKIVDLQGELNTMLKTGDISDPNLGEAVAVLQAEIDGNLKANFMDQRFAGKRVDELSNKDKKILLNLASRRTRIQKIIDGINGNNLLSDKQKASAIQDKMQIINNMEGKKRQILNNSMYSKDADKLTKATVKLAAEKGLTIKTITEKPGQGVEQAAYEYVKNSDLSAEQKKQLIADLAKFFILAKDAVHGAAIGAEVGLPMQFQLSGNFTGDEIGNASVHSHELGHNTLDVGFLQDNPKAFALVDQFFKYTNNRYKGLNKFVDNQLEKGKYVKKERVEIDEKTGKKTKKVIGQYDSTTKEGRLAIAAEKLAFSIDYIRKYHNEDIDKSLKGKLLDSWLGFTKGKVDPDLQNEVNNGEDVYNLLKDYASGFDVGRFSGKAAAIMDKAAKKIKEAKDSGKATKSKAKKSTSNLQSTLDSKYKGDVKKMGRESIGVDPSGKPLSGTDVTKSLLAKEIGAMVTDIVKRYFKPIMPQQLQRAGLTEDYYKQALIGLASSILNPAPGSTELFDRTVQTLDKFLSSRLYFRAKSLATKLGVPQEFTVNIDDVNESSLFDDNNLEGGVDTQDDIRARVVKDFTLININNAIIEPAVIDKINDLIEKNPKNLQEEITKLVEKDFANLIIQQMGEITGNAKDFKVSQKYKDFHNENNYRKMNDALSAQEIMNNYTKGKNAPYTVKKVDEKDYKNLKSDDPKLKKDSYYRKGVYDITATPAKWFSYFTEGGFTTLRDRRKKLAIKIAASFTKLAAQNYIIENSSNMDAVAKAELSKWVDSQDKQKSENRTFNNVKYSYGAMKDGLFIYEELKNGKKVFDKNGELTKKYNKIPKAVGDFVYNFLLQDGKVRNIGDVSKIQFIGAALKNLVSKDRGTAYETHVIDQAIAVEKYLGKGVIDVIMRFPDETDGRPDFQIKIYGNLFNAEVKMDRAQYSSVTFTPDGSPSMWTIKKDYSFNDKIMQDIGVRAKKGVELTRKFLKEKYNYDWSDLRYLPDDLYTAIRNEKVEVDGKLITYAKSMETEMDFKLSSISEIYNNKKHAVHYIHIMGRGLFNMGKDILNFKLPKFEGKGKIKLRIIPNSKYIPDYVLKEQGIEGQSIKDGMKYLTWRAIPSIPDMEVVGKSPHSLGTFGGQIKFFQSSEVSNLRLSQSMQNKDTFGQAVVKSRSINKPTKGITVLDFDDTLATSKSLIRYTKPNGEKGTLTPEQYASTYQDLLGLGYKFDFSEFNKVVDGKTAPLFNKALKLQGKFGSKSMFVLTARPAESAPAIFAFLKANGLNIPLENITGLANSTSEAKALWIAGKVGEGFNDFYFADDALQNVQAVKNMLDQFDVKSKVQQAKVKFSQGIDKDFNNILEDVTGIESQKRFSTMKARKRGASKGKFRFFIPPSHEDFVGLLYNFMGKGKKGDAHRNFFEQALVRPLNRAYREIDAAKQAIANDYKALNKQMPEVNKMLSKKTPDGDFTYQDAVRVYIWSKHGYDIPGLTPSDQAILIDLVSQNPDLQAYAEAINTISKQDTYVDPGPNWETGNIRIDLVDATGRVGRKTYFTEFQENADIMFSEENLNKIEAAYGKPFREALEDMLYRIKTGINRPKGSSAKPNMFMNWLNASVAGVMFFNTRSALLQQMSNVNYLNFADNNIFAAGKAFANQLQYWKDFAMIFNSDMLKQRRGGLQTDINGAELAEAIKKARPGNLFDQVAIITGKALRLGFLPTQIGDNIAIATGGAAFYRNRVNKYIKDGLSQKEAETKAFTDFQDITQSTQQSARPDMTSKQQASWIGKLILNFLNTPSQYNRIIKKAGSDILNKRITPPNTSLMQSNMSNASRILYYGAAQNLIFYSLQTALFAVMFGSDDEDEDKRVEQYLKKKERVINGSIDTILRGSGIYGVALSTLKNMAIKFLEQREKGYNKDESAVVMELFNFSPVVGIKARRIVNAEKTLNYNKKVIEEMETFDIDNPMWSAVTNYTQTITTAPTNKIYQKTINLRNAADRDYTALQRLLFFSGYTTWSLNLGDTKKMKAIKDKIKADTKKKKKKKTRGRGTR